MQRDMLTERHIPRVQCTIPIPAQEAFLTLARCCQVGCRKLLVINLQDTLHFIVYLQFWYFQQLLCNHAALTLYLFPLSHVRKVWSEISTKFQVLYSSYFSNDSSLFLQNFALSILLFTRSVSTGCKLLFQLPGPFQSLKTCHGKVWIPEEEHLDPLHHSYLYPSGGTFWIVSVQQQSTDKQQGEQGGIINYNFKSEFQRAA